MSLRGAALVFGSAIALLGGVAARAPAAAAAADKWTPLDTLEYRLVTDPQVSPDGRRVAYVVRDAIMEKDKSEFRTQIWISPSGGGAPLQATFAEQSSSRPRWSADGAWLALLSKRGDAQANVWLQPTASGEAWRLTDAKSDVTQYAWSPDGRSLAFVAAEPPPADKERRDRERDDAHVIGDDDRPGRLWLITVPPEAGGAREARSLLLGDRSIGGPAGPASIAWSPDGKTIAFAHTPRPIADDWPGSDISLVDVASGAVRPLAATGASETSPLFSPDGKWVAYLTTDDPPRWAHRRWIRLAPVDGGPARDLPASFDESPDLAGFSADGRTLYFSEAKGISEFLYAQSIETGAIRALTPSGVVCDSASVNARGAWIGFVRQGATEPGEAWASALAPFAPRRASNANADLPRHPFGQTRPITWKGKGGDTIEGLLTLPVEYRAGQTYPLLLVVHGGPAGVYQATFLAVPGPYSAAVFAAEGYALLRANPRGSSGYGTRFRQGNIGDWGGGDTVDLRRGVDAVVAMKIADPDRLGIMGWSYGGYMTAWMITQTPLFKAASVGAGVTDLVSFTGTSDIPSFVPDYFGGDFWGHGQLDLYLAHSAIAHVDAVSTPTLIQHGEIDERVPVSQSYELYNALKRRGVPTQMITYPRQHHPVREPRLILDLAQRNLAWMNRYVRGIFPPTGEGGSASRK